MGHAYGVHPDVLEQTLKPGDRLLLCSDGLYGGIFEHAIQVLFLCLKVRPSS